ncbi:hypothetical protein DAEQUDRAFT_762089 [Daedalea quercina L-15889]|uniref:F-box domain-containing protein n=1 Tax=Daedalea quercina L-15889 TaxID=1314783 RepID=A0A165TM60_9APHY|nr:hypothetical protein DAEQUDRAFT_762089 [Daedalea quercina L-15889]
MTPDPKLPIEVQECILVQLHDDYETLKACSMVCRAWSWATRTQLFRRIELRNRCNCVLFLSLLEESSRAGTGVSNLVRELQLPRLGFPNRGARLDRRLELLRSITRRLPMVEVLRVENYRIDALLYCLWSEDEGFNMQGAILSILSFPNLKTLQFSYMETESVTELLEFLGAFPTVSTLHLHHISTRGGSIALDRAAIQAFVTGRQQGPISIQELSGNDFLLSREQFSEITALMAHPFELALKRLEWTNQGTSSWMPCALLLQNMVHGARVTLEHLLLDFSP